MISPQNMPKRLNPAIEKVEVPENYTDHILEQERQQAFLKMVNKKTRKEARYERKQEKAKAMKDFEEAIKNNIS